MPLSARLAWTLLLLALIFIGYAAAGAAGLIPLPRSMSSLAGSDRVGRGYALVTGNYYTQPFVSNGNGLPPYAFGGADSATRVHVTPSEADLRAYKVVAVIDLATGNGSEWTPYVVHTIGPFGTFVAGLVVSGLVLVALLFWIAGYIALLAQPRGRLKEAQRTTR